MPMGSQNDQRMESLRRYVTCPVCNVSFHPGQVKRTITSFTCPECGELLQYQTGWFAYVWFFLCLYGVPGLLYYLGYRNLKLILVAVAAAPLTFWFGVLIQSLVVPARAQQKLKYGDSGLHLTDKPKRREDIGPTP